MFDVVSRIGEPRHLFSAIVQLSCHTAVEPSANDAVTMNAWTAVVEEQEHRHQAIDSMNQSGSDEPSRFVNVNQATLRDLVNADDHRQVAGCLHGSVATAVEEAFTDAIQVATDFVASQKKLALNRLSDVLVCRMIESGQVNSYLETLLSSLAESTTFLDSTVCRDHNSKSNSELHFSQLVENTLHNQV